jgi:hypothetical protein
VQGRINFSSFTQILNIRIELLASTLYQQNVETIPSGLQTHHDARRSRTDHGEIGGQREVIG